MNVQLLNLPNEILTLIFDLLPQKDLNTHLTTCSKFCNIVSYVIKHKLIDCGKNKEKAIRLADVGFKVKLDLSFTDITDATALGNVYELDLSFTNVTDVSALGNVYSLDLRGTKVTDVSALKNVKELNLPYVTDVPVLGKVHTLDLSD